MPPTPSYTSTTHGQPCQIATPISSRMPLLASPVSLQQQEAPSNFEDLTKGGNEDWTGRVPLLPHHRNHSLPTHIDHCGTDSSLETHRMLSNVLYDLRLEYGKKWSTPEFECPRRDGIFRSVSFLCDVVQEVLTDREALEGPPANIDSETNITFMLTLTAISMILNIYKSLCQMYSGCSEVRNRGKEALNLEHSFVASALQQSKASASLHKVVQLTTMDFHLTRLQRMFTIPNTPSSFQTALIDTGEGSEEIQELRTVVQGLIESLKSA